MFMYSQDYLSRLCSKFIYYSVTDVKSAFTVWHAVAGPTIDTIRFDRVVTNIGGHYNTNTGKFTCPYPGLYVFSLHVVKVTRADNAYCYIRQNNADKVIAFSDPSSDSDSGYDSGSVSVVLHLIRGDVVDLGHCTVVSKIYPNERMTVFSGFLLKAD